jgi:NADH-quinone oxidoreductase subunit I
MAILKNIAAIAKGMSVTFLEMFQPTTVENYPKGSGPLKGAQFQERFRGVHVLQRDENGLEKCVACFLCAAACPSNCIYIEAAENTAEKRVSGAFFADIASRPVRPTLSPMGTDSRLRPSMPVL